jgi:hypothetical protein
MRRPRLVHVVDATQEQKHLAILIQLQLVARDPDRKDLLLRAASGHELRNLRFASAFIRRGRAGLTVIGEGPQLALGDGVNEPNVVDRKVELQRREAPRPLDSLVLLGVSRHVWAIEHIEDLALHRR